MRDASAFDQFIEARFRLLRQGNSPEHGEGAWKALLSPRFWNALLAPVKPEIYSAVEPKDKTVAGIPFSISKDLKPGQLAVLFCGREPFDPAHPERTVVVEEADHAGVA